MKPVIAKSVYSTLQSLSHPLAPYLHENLAKARVVSDQQVENTTISLNSRVEFMYEPASAPIRIQIVLPEQEDLKKRRVSVLAPISRTLLGYKQNDLIITQMPSGEKKIRVLSVKN